jgi:hypothetical protein
MQDALERLQEMAAEAGPWSPYFSDDEEPVDDDKLLRRIHERLKLGIDIHTFADDTVEVRWVRDYEGEWSDERFFTASSLSAALQGVLDHEDQADEADALEA